ncbi:MAG: metallophosphoesterase family protein [Dinghuibacter sp.]|nr:metallophosphoesterase family protein [Dinghuibacter sp.]
MLIGIISDIHANEFALERVLNSAREKKVQRLFVLGDLVGYYFSPGKVLSLLSQWDTQMIRGNHEDIFAAYFRGNNTHRSTVDERLGPGFASCITDLDEANQQFLFNLPESISIEIEGIRFGLYHGSPGSTTEYIYPDADPAKLALYDDEDKDIAFMGHTHHPMIYPGKHTLFINPGSVGQSRVVGGLAQWGIFNTKNKVYTPVNTIYNTQPLKEQILERGVPRSHFIYQVLERK